jgi:hypothetical protein
MNDFIKIDFVLGEEPMIYRDALYLPSDHTFSDADIEAMKQERYDNWVALVKWASEALPDG